MTIIAIAIIAFGVRLSVLGNQSQKMNPELGVQDGKLQKCPNKPNCVVSFYPDDKEHYLAPIKTEQSLDEIKKTILKSDLDWKITQEGENYIHYNFKSSLMGFVDDIELYKSEDLLHFRSASRVGYSDLGANKKRILKLKDILK